jgi:hypothetical protein
MAHRERLVLWSVVVALLVLGAWAAASAEPMEATISLGRDPEPPICTLNPGGTVDITWDIEHTTTPNYVYYKIEDPTRTVIYEDSTYAGSSGITAARQWAVPVGAPDGKYWIRVEYWSFEASNEANAEVTFYVCSETAVVCAEKREDQNCNDVLDGEDTPIADWWICLETPLGDTFCKQTDLSGQVCWGGLALGDYTIYEVLPDGWVAIYPESHNFTLTVAGDTFMFFNKVEGASALEKSSLGRIKGMFNK